MALNNIKGDLVKLIEKSTELQDDIREDMGLYDFHQITITADETANSLQKGTQRLLLKAGYSRPVVKRINDEHNNLDQWKILIARMYNELVAGPRISKHGFSNLVVIEKLNSVNKVLGKRGVYLLPSMSNSRRLTIRLFNIKKTQKTSSKVDDVTLNGFASAFRDYAFLKWKDSLPDSLKGNTAPGGQVLENAKRSEYGAAASQQFGIRTPFVHEEGSEVGTRVLENIRDGLDEYQESPDFQLAGVSGVYNEVIASLISELKLTYEDKMIPTEDGGVKYARLVKGKIGGVNFAGSSPGDMKKIKSRLLEILGDYLQNNAKKFGFDAETGLDYETSKPIRRVLAENAKNKIVKNAKKKIKNTKARKVKTKTTSKAAKKESRSHPVKSPKRKKPKTITAAIAVKGKSSKRVEERKQQKAAGLNKLRAQIQKRLPAEVRRNMGRPELINRTGAFSNSAQLVNLRRTKMGISGEYTYKLNPYATFENLGQRKWPTGYNPKPLIAKSIRELAMQYTQDRITSLRRI